MARGLHTPRPESRDRESAEILDLASLGYAMRQRWWVVASCVLVALVIAAVAADVLGTRHAAVLTVRATERQEISSLTGTGRLTSVEDERRQLIHQLQSPSLLQYLDAGVDQNDFRIYVEAPERSPLLTITVIASSEEAASSAATEAVSSIIDERRQEAIRQAAGVAENLREEAAQLEARSEALRESVLDDQTDPTGGEGEGETPQDAPESEAASEARLQLVQPQLQALLNRQSEYERRATEVEIDAATVPIGIQLVTTEEPATEAASPRPIDLVFLLAFAGVLTGLGIIWVKELRHGPRMTSRRIEHAFAGIPVVGTGATDVVAMETFAVRVIEEVAPRSTIAYIEIGRSTTSYREGAARFVQAMQNAGVSTTLVNCDFRSGPRDSPPGVTTWLAGKAQTVEVLQHDSSESGLSFIDSGPAAPRPLLLAKDARMRELVSSLSTSSDCVLLVLPDPRLVPEAAFLLDPADSAILEVVKGYVHERTVDEIQDRLDAHEIDVVGILALSKGTERPRGSTEELDLGEGTGWMIASQEGKAS